jgi:hypothetical protein
MSRTRKSRPIPEPIEDLDLEARARFVYEACHRAGLLNGFLAWDRREFKDGDWEGVLSGLKEDEKRRWRAVASQIQRSGLFDFDTKVGS